MKSIFTTIALIIFCLQLHAQPGTLDYSFGDSGKVISTTYNGYAYASVLQPDGKILIGGGYGYYIKDNAPITGSLITRYNTNGSLDLSFGDSGRAVYDLGDTKYSKIIYAIELQKDGKIVAAVKGFSSSSVAIMRLNEDGTLDKSFGKDGLATMPNQDGDYSCMDMVLLPDGRITITGNYTFDINQGSRPFVTCFTSDGYLDKNFGDGGTVIIRPNSTIIINCIAATKEGKIIIGGEYFVIYKTVLLQFNSDGTQDKSFGNNGLAEMPFEKRTVTPILTDIAITTDNTIAAVGYAYPNNSINPAILASRFLENGAADSSFNGKAYNIVKYDGSDAYARALAVQANGKIVAGGDYLKGGKEGVTIIRFDQDGIVDSLFGANGITETSLTNSDIGSSLLIQKDGKIVQSGYSYTVNVKDVVTLIRYNGDDSKKQIIVTKIKRWLQHHGVSWQTNNNVRYYNVQRSNDGGITYKPVAKIYNNRQPQYNYEEAAVTNNSLYRIAAVGKDGSRTYSNSILINNEASVSVFPNPVRNNLQVQGLAADGKTNISISDFSGTVRTSAVASGSTYSLNTSNLKPGNYLLKVQHDNTVTTQTFVKE